METHNSETSVRLPTTAMVSTGQHAHPISRCFRDKPSKLIQNDDSVLLLRDPVFLGMPDCSWQHWRLKCIVAGRVPSHPDSESEAGSGDEGSMLQTTPNRKELQKRWQEVRQRFTPTLHSPCPT